MLNLLILIGFLIVGIMAITMGVLIIKEYDKIKSLFISIIMLIVGGIFETIGIIYIVISFIGLFTIM